MDVSIKTQSKWFTGRSRSGRGGEKRHATSAPLSRSRSNY